MRYYTQNNVKIIQCAVEEFSIQMNDSAKKNVNESTYINAGFFGWYKSSISGKSNYTLPVCPLVADFRTTDTEVINACKTRTKVIGNKAFYDCYNDDVSWNNYRKHKVTTFVIENGKARFEENAGLKDSYQYAVGGVALIRDGRKVTWDEIKAQGFGGDSLYATMHNLIGLKANDDSIYLLNWKSTTGNMVSSGEAYKKFSAMGFTNLLKLDGGGSCIMKEEGKIVAATSENRRVNNIIVVKNTVKQNNITNNATNNNTTTNNVNPYPVPTRTLKYGCKGNDVKWLQFQLCKAGIKTDIDGSFGNGTRTSVITYQKRKGLDPDASVGPITRKSLQTL